MLVSIYLAMDCRICSFHVFHGKCKNRIIHQLIAKRFPWPSSRNVGFGIYLLAVLIVHSPHVDLCV